MTETIPVVNGTPATGTVTFSDNGAVIGTGTINAQGVATYTTTTLPVGTDPITASYPGNTNYTNVTSGPVNEVVNKANGPDTLAVNPDPAVFGTTVTITDTVPTVGGVAPTGTVTFTNNGTTIGTATIINGVATLTTTTLPVGTDPISGAYSGDGNYAPITTGPVNETITTGNTMPVLGATPNPTTFGTTVTLTESIPGINGVTPTGTVKFFDNGTQIGTGSVPVVNGVATLPTSTLPIGTDPITAVYSGDTNYSTANSGPLNVVVNKAAPIDTVTAAPNPTTFGTTVTITFTVPILNSVAPTGVVTFLSGTTPIGTGNVNAAGIATITTNTLPVGSDPITAQYPGDTTYAPESPTTTEVVAKATGIGDTLASNPNPSVFGSPVIITETLPTVGGVAPSGTVTFFYPAGTAIGTVTVSNGTASITTSTLPVGTDPITATYSGDSNYATVNSGPDNQVVGTATAQATLAVGPNPATFGTPVTISETLIPINGVCPPGPVSFFSNGTLIGTGTVNSGCVATVTTSTLPVGTDAITATAPASGSFAAVTSGPVAEVINKANGPDTLTTSPNPSTFGQNVTITDTIPTVGGVAPTGTVNFYDFGTLIGTGTVTNGVATLVTGTLPVGTDSITGVYQGDGNYAVVTAGPVNQVVTAVSSTATLAVGPNPTTFGTAVTMTETIPVVNGTPATGTVTFSNNGAVIGTGAINAQGVATFTTTTLPVGTDPITASYPGNTTYNPVNSGPVNEVVNKANGPDTLAVNPDPAVFGTTVTITDTVPTVGGVAPTGTVTFTNNGTTIGTAPIINGVATLTTTTLPVGSDPISGAYGGDGNYAPITAGPVNEIITTGNTTPVLGATPNPTTFGTPVTITESIPGINGVTPTGTVNFFDNGTAIGTGTVTNGVATLVTSTLPIGTDPITATYSGDKNYGTANSGPLNVVVNKAAPADTVVGAPNPSNSGTQVTLTFTVPPVNGVPPTGVVTFYNGTTPIGTGTVNASGIATLTTSSLPIGTDTITAKYPGDNTYAPASPTTTLTVNAVPGTGDTLTASPNPTVFGNPVTLTFCIPVVSGAAVPTGTVTFSVGGTTINTPVTIGTTPVNGCYVATTTTSNLPVGAPTTVTGTYAPGPASGYGPDAPTAPVTVAPVNPTSVITYTPTSPTCSSTLVTLTDTITPVNGVVPTGTVQFYATVNGVVTPIGTPQTVVPPGVATLTIALPCGTTGIYGIYTGLSPYGTSTTPTVPLSLADFTISVTPTAQTVNPGDTAVSTVNLAGVGGVAYTSPVTLTATGLPPGATVTFGTPTLVPGIGPTPTTMTIVTSPTVALNRPSHGNGIYYGLLLLPLLGIRRIRRKIRALPRGITYCLAALLLLGGLGAVTGCSGGYFGGGPNAFTITVTGTSGTVTHSTTVTLTVE
jgi:predicted thioesterase